MALKCFQELWVKTKYISCTSFHHTYMALVSPLTLWCPCLPETQLTEVVGMVATAQHLLAASPWEFSNLVTCWKMRIESVQWASERSCALWNNIYLGEKRMFALKSICYVSLQMVGQFGSVPENVPQNVCCYYVLGRKMLWEKEFT